MKFINKIQHSAKILIPKLLVISLLFVSASVFSLDLHEAKKQGLVGETTSGYLEAVGHQSSDTSKLVTNINGKRRAHYERIATKNSIPLKNVELLAGKKSIEKTAAEQYIKVGGEWKRK